MSTPPEQPSPSPYQSPAGQGANPGPIPGQPTVGGYGAPVPPQHNPYAQSGPYGQPPAAAPPAGYYPPMPGMPGAPGTPGAAPGRGGAGKAVLWGVVGAVVASALWGGGLLLFGKDGKASADLRGYTVQKDLCATQDISAFKSSYPTDDDDPTKYTAKSESVDEMYCDVGLEMEGSTYSDAYLSVQVDLHKKTDPGPEFADTWRTYSQHDDDYKVTPLIGVAGLGDEAYLITEDGTSSRYITLAVRDGWMTYSMRWSAYDTSSDTDSTTMPTIDEASDWVKSSTKATLPRLKE